MLNAADAIAAVGLFGSVAFTIRTIAHAWGKRQDGRADVASSDQIASRLARIESAVDAIAIEVERIAEAQRFMARLSSERDAQRLPSSTPSSAGGRSITPH
jgi:hypothetical protein